MKRISAGGLPEGWPQRAASASRVVAVLLLGAALAAPPGEAAAAKTLVYCSEGSPDSFNAALSTTTTTFDASSRAVFDRLVQYRPGTTDLEPGLARSWEIGDDGRAYTFHLRPGVRFHGSDAFTPSRDLDADDVIFSIDRQRSDGHPFHQVGGGAYPVFDSLGLAQLIQAVEKLDDLTVRLRLARPEAPLLADLAMDFASIQSAEYAEAMLRAGTPEEVDQQPIGTGPFRWQGYQQDAVIRYAANLDYWQGASAIDRLIFAITPDASVRLAKIEAGECQVTAFPNPADLAAIRRQPDLRLVESDGLNIGYLAFNVTKPPLDDVRVRRALAMAIDRRAIVEAVYQGAATPARSPIPPGLWAYDPTLPAVPYDPAAAKRLLAEAGHQGGFATDLWAMPVQRAYNPNARRMAELIQADWAKIGVTAPIVSYEWGEYLRRSKLGEHQTILLGWTAQNADPDNILSVNLSCASVASVNRARWCDPAFDDLLAQSRATTDRPSRARLYDQAQRILVDRLPWDPIAHARIYEVVRKEVRGYRNDPFGAHVFYGVDLTEP
jgi:dipeptide transport system substrate-binding protein